MPIDNLKEGTFLIGRPSLAEGNSSLCEHRSSFSVSICKYFAQQLLRGLSGSLQELRFCSEEQAKLRKRNLAMSEDLAAHKL